MRKDDRNLVNGCPAQIFCSVLAPLCIIACPLICYQLEQGDGLKGIESLCMHALSWLNVKHLKEERPLSSFANL